MCALPEASFSAPRASRRLLNLPRHSNPSSGLKSQNLQRAKFARFSGWGLAAAVELWARGAPPRGWWPSGLASVSEAGGPGLGSSLARALVCVAVSCFSWLCDGFLLPAARNRGAASEVTSRSAIAQFNFPSYSSRY